jgi:hypothetical protein
VKLTLVVIDA